MTNDTYSFWSNFGEGVILVLIQIGGIGFMTLAISALTFTGKKIGLSQRLLIKESVAAPQVGGIVRMSKFVLSGTLFFEILGAVILAFYFIPRLGMGKGIYYSIFHSISAFCNAGIDLMGYYEPSSSLVTAADSYIVGITISLLIIIGGKIQTNIAEDKRFKNWNIGALNVEINGGTINTKSNYWAGLACGLEGNIKIKGGSILTTGGFPIGKVDENDELVSNIPIDGTNNLYLAPIQLSNIKVKHKNVCHKHIKKIYIHQP